MSSISTGGEFVLKISEKNKNQILYLIIPVIWHIIYLFFSGKFDKLHRVYWDLIFYLVIAVYFIAVGTFSFKDLWSEWKKGRKFWLPVLLTLIATVAAFGSGMIISSFIRADEGMGVFRVVDLPSLLAFAITTIFLPPIAEEAFYRKAIINFDNSFLLILTSVIGIILYASEHSLKPLGLLIAAVWAVPFTISYIKTKNIYIPIMAHFLCNLAMNGFTVIFTAMKILS